MRHKPAINPSTKLSYLFRARSFPTWNALELWNYSILYTGLEMILTISGREHLTERAFKEFPNGWTNTHLPTKLLYDECNLLTFTL